MEVSGVRTAAGWAEFVTRQNEGLDLRLSFSWEIKPNSDHYPFFARGIPYLMLHTGLHPDYHTPADDPDKINFEKLEKLLRLVHATTWTLANQDPRPRQTATAR